jgi:type VI secretion system protein ImpJ
VAKPKDLGSVTVSGFSAEGIANAWFLHCVNSCLAPLRHLCISKRAHPEELFVELSRLAGALCTFSFDSHPSALPLYDHIHLAECFEALDRHIRAHLELIVPSNCVAIGLSPGSRYFYEGRIIDERALYGLPLSHIPVPPPALSPKIEFQYFAIDKSGPCWEHMVKTREVGIYVPGELPDPEIELSVLLE